MDCFCILKSLQRIGGWERDCGTTVVFIEDPPSQLRAISVWVVRMIELASASEPQGRQNSTTARAGVTQLTSHIISATVASGPLLGVDLLRIPLMKCPR
jgi:hypothetical protein